MQRYVHVCTCNIHIWKMAGENMNADVHVCMHAFMVNQACVCKYVCVLHEEHECIGACMYVYV